MTEPYVSLAINIVDKACVERQVNSGSFWDWLGNAKFQEDDGNLTRERAAQIRKNVHVLIDEFQSQGSPKRSGRVVAISEKEEADD